MSRVKKFIKKYFGSFVFFYSYLRNKVFVAFGLSIAVSLLDGLGLSMFLPLLQMVGGDNVQVDASEMGNLAHLIHAIEAAGIPLSLVSVLIIMICFFIFKGIAVYISNIYRIILQQSFIKKVRLDLLRNLNRMSFKKFILSDAGRIQNTMSGEVDRLSSAFVGYFGTLQHAVMLVVYIGFAFFLDAKFAILVSLGGGLTHFLYHFIYKHTRGASKRLTRYNHVFQGQIIQHVGNFKYLKATGRVHQYGNRLENTIHKIESSRRRIGFLASISMAAREPLLVIIIALVIFVQIQFLGGKMGTMLISLLFFYRGLTALVAMQESWNFFLQVSGSMENMKEFQKTLYSSLEKNGKTELESFEREIVFDRVHFCYGDTVILEDINLKISKNQSVAFVGESGSGKTTMVNLVAGLLHPNKGSITVDGISVRDLKKETYQSRIGYVSQDSVIFNDTIYNNITFWAPKTPENLKRFEKSIEQASLKEFLDRLPEGPETELGNNGINLSGGQKQRVSIARELFKEIDILILDEATSALDSETEMAIQKNIDALQGNYTVIIVAHRLATIRNVDRVVLMDRGKIKAADTFDNLIKSQKQFKKMVELQEL